MQGIQQLAKRVLPRPGELGVQIRPNVKVLVLSDAINTLTRRVENELIKRKAAVQCLQVSKPQDIETAVRSNLPDIVVCPFLKTRVPKSLFDNKPPILIMHPGIAGDKGASSIDWAILERQKSWGVTVLEASPEMDGGDIWSTDNFLVPYNATKTGLYNGSVSDSAVKCITDAVSRFCQNVRPINPKNHSQEITGMLKRNMKHADREINWNQPAEEIALKVRMSDTTPGALGQLALPNLDRKLRMFDAHVETTRNSEHVRQLLQKARPGEPVARRNKSMLVKAGDDAGVWIGQMKENTKTASLKLPSLDCLPQLRDLPEITEPCATDDVICVRKGDVVYVSFDFYNGAMDTDQAKRLTEKLQLIDKDPDVKTVALLGGDRFFSTGIHLCVIENSENKQKEAWDNINGIDDVIKTIVNMKNKVSVAVLRGNAGAGGAMLAAACDVAVSHPGVLLTPSYKSMSLFGSEYWTYFFPQRVGVSRAQQLINDTTPISADAAANYGLLDKVLGSDKYQFMDELPEFLKQLSMDGEQTRVLNLKETFRNKDWSNLIENHRKYELTNMKENFASEEFLTAMADFVYKRK